MAIILNPEEIANDFFIYVALFGFIRSNISRLP